MTNRANEYIIDRTVPELSYGVLLKHSAGFADTNSRGYFNIVPSIIDIDFGLFTNPSIGLEYPIVSVSQLSDSLILNCPCGESKRKMCSHQFQVIQNIIRHPYLRIFFDTAMRKAKIIETAKNYGIDDEVECELYFDLVYLAQSYEIRPKIKELVRFDKAEHEALSLKLLPQEPSKPFNPASDSSKKIVAFTKHKYYEQISAEIIEVETGKNGKMKSPLLILDPLELINNTEVIAEVKFYAAVAKLQNVHGGGDAKVEIEALKQLLLNPLGLEFYFHDKIISDTITINSLKQIELFPLKNDVQLNVFQKEPFYEITGEITIRDKQIPFKELAIRYKYFIELKNKWYLIPNTDLLRVIDYFKSNNEIVIIHKSKFDEFKSSILDELENQISINYAFIKAASKKQIASIMHESDIHRIIYLTDQEHFINITPVVRYGQVEIPVFSRKQIYDKDQNGNLFKVERDDQLEIHFTSLLLRQHPEFSEQLNEFQYFYLHKDKFLDEDWFLGAFETWRNEGIIILGFNELKKNKLNSNKANISISVNSGIDWFNIHVNVKFGKQKANLKQLYKAAKSKSKYVQLDDGSQGIIPEIWLKKFADFFNAGEVLEEMILVPKINFTELSELFEDEVLSREVSVEIENYKSKFTKLENIPEVKVPDNLKAELRHYQEDGLNWLNFLDDHNFGGCLADDMGLGKTVQVIAFILSLREKHLNNTNLVVVPTSLLFNWQDEVSRFAPDLKIYSHYGPNRPKSNSEFSKFEIILTTYGMMLSDIRFLKEFDFNYVILDESQAIKNPESERYKAARLLKARNRLVLTGTPIENNTFDIYGQLSFACPGLLGNKLYFSQVYSNPIDQFEDVRRSKELEEKIRPFILRRTKKQVATELPAKTEMVIYCQMGEEQRRIYDKHETELRDYITAKDEAELSRSNMHVLAGLTRLRQICDSPALLKEEDAIGDHSSKIDVLIDQIRNKSAQHKILVFSQFVSMLDLVRKELVHFGIPHEYLTGQSKNRAASVNEFQNNNEVRVFLISLKAGGTGLNLTEADYVYLLDPWWNPAVENQAIDRVYRIGQNKNVIAVRLICPDTIEEKIMKLQESKRKLVGDLIKSEQGGGKMTKEELLDIL